ncbi:tetratricopeptide repeat protein [Streptomyces hirsutus]|uniref:Tetratricopeptide repeat protein n=1 Tax=Streptomyces hirsutus TaxID=35620 RepID=A0ABZ1GR92_9ACTN|nr:tetratricopeptide repeat protein [Streptomyces hirsutus]WSD07953.1 tetratricopeptide repeat protein [Streptomyces hirsutus]
MTRFDVYISDDGFARIDQEPVTPAPGESVHEAVLDHLQRYAERYGTPVQATVTEGPGDAHFTLEVAPDGSSRVLAPEEPEEPEESEEPEDPEVPEGPTDPEVSEGPEASEGPREPAAPEDSEDSEDLEVSEAPAPVPHPVAGSALAAAVARARATAAGDAANSPARISIPAQATAPEPELVPGQEPAMEREAEPSPSLSPAPEPEPEPASGPPPEPTRRTTRGVTEELSAPVAAVDLSPELIERITRINALAAVGRLDEALDDATALREAMTAEMGAEHPDALEARAMEAYLAHLRGDHREATVLALSVARILCGAGDPQAPAAVARAAAAWQRLDDDRAAEIHGNELLHMWGRLHSAGRLSPADEHLAHQVRIQLEDLTAYV